MIINIRGTSGSGKTHTTKQLMRLFDGGEPEPLLYGSHSNFKYLAERYPQKVVKSIGYTGTLSYPPIPPSTQEVPHTVSIVGRYETACGGCDTIKTQDEICDRVRAFATRGD